MNSNDKNHLISKRKYPKVDRKHGLIMGIKVSVTPRKEVLEIIRSKLDNKEKFYIVTPNPEIVLMATKDWLLKKAIDRCDLSIPDGIGLSQAYKFLNFNDENKSKNPKKGILRPFKLFYQGMIVAFATFFNKRLLTDSLEITKGRELFLDIVKIADEMKLKVYLFGGENGEQEKTKEILSERFKNATFKTHHKFPIYNKNGQPVSEVDRKIHKTIVGSIKLFEPDFIFVAMTPPKQEKWIYRNFFRTKAIGAMACGGTYHFIAGSLPIPPKWMENLGLEWIWRFLSEPKVRWRRILNAFPIFPWKVFMWKLNPPRRQKQTR